MAASTAIRVLPMPPGPVSVTSRDDAIRFVISSISALAANEARQLFGEVVPRHVVERLQWRE